MKKLFCIALSVILLLSVFTFSSSAEYNENLEKDFYSECVLLVCTDNDEIIFSKNINKQTKPASLTKIVTASVVLDNLKDMDQQVTIQESCITELNGTGSSMSGLKAGEIVTVYDLLCCLLIPSANDAATNLAYLVTGEDRQAFIDKMNTLAEKLGCDNSNFVNCHGLDDDDQYTTAADMAKFLEHAMEFPVFKEIVAKSSYTIPKTNMHDERTINTTNFTLIKAYKDYYCPYSNGGKTGSTSKAGHCLVSSASKDGYDYIAVCLNSVKKDLDGDYVDENGAFIDTKTMYDWAFENLRLVSIADSTKIVGEIPVKFGKQADYVTLSPAENSFGLMPNGIDSSSLLIRILEDTVPNKLSAPIEKGEKICKGEILYADKVIATVDLVASSEIKRSFGSYLVSQIGDLFTSSIVKIAGALVFVALIILLIAKWKNKGSKKSKQYNVLDFKDFNTKK